MIRLVQSADAGKAKIVGMADRWATWIVVIALSAAALTWFFTGEIIRSVTILVVFCPCALVLATPTAIMAAIGNATKHGFLVREGDALERLAKVSKITFDKTGTLTYGTPVVVACKSADTTISDTKLYRYVACYRKEQDENLLEAEEFAMLPGQGIEAVLEGKKVLAGNEKLLENQNVVVSANQKEEMQHFLGHL